MRLHMRFQQLHLRLCCSSPRLQARRGRLKSLLLLRPCGPLLVQLLLKGVRAGRDACPCFRPQQLQPRRRVLGVGGDALRQTVESALSPGAWEL